MSMKLKLPLVVALVVAGCAAFASPVRADDGSKPAPAYAAVSGEEQPSWLNPKAHASCPFCVFAVVVAVKAAQVVRAARAARVIQVAIVAARTAARSARKVSRATIRRVQREAATISRRGARWTKKKWPAFRAETQACLATAAFMEERKFMRDNRITRDEWFSYELWGPKLMDPVQSAFIAFPIVFTPSQVYNKATEIAESCALGVTFSWAFNKRGVVPK